MSELKLILGLVLSWCDVENWDIFGRTFMLKEGGSAMPVLCKNIMIKLSTIIWHFLKTNGGQTMEQLLWKM